MIIVLIRKLKRGGGGACVFPPTGFGAGSWGSTPKQGKEILNIYFLI
eukprot:COSAG06_NODE_38075_length_427_cov_3.274390_1_plen_46_part_01